MKIIARSGANCTQDQSFAHRSWKAHDFINEAIHGPVAADSDNAAVSTFGLPEDS
jgi:hypothetical protein